MKLKQFRWPLFGVLLLCLVVFVLIYWRHQEPNNDYYFVPKSVEEQFQFWNMAMEGAKTAADELGIQLYCVGALKETDVAKQIEIIEEIIEKKPKGIILAPGDQDELVSVCEKIMDAGIELVLIDSDVNINRPKALVQTDNIRAAMTVGHLLAQSLGEGEVVIFSHVEGTSTAIKREQGFRNAIEQYPSITIADEVLYSDGQEEKAYRLALKFFEEHKDIKGVFATNEKTAMGVGRAIKELGMVEDLVFVGFDADATQVKFIEEGIMLGSMVQKPFNMGYIGVKEAYNIANNGKEPTYISTEFQWITKENLFTSENEKLLFPFAD